MSTNPTKRKWSAKQRRFIQWLSRLEQDRTPKTQAELAGELKLRPETLSRWRQLPGFLEAVGEAAFLRLYQRTPLVLEVIGKKAEAGELHFVKLLLELNEKFKQCYGEDAVLFTEEEYYKAIMEVEEWESKRFGPGSGKDE